MPSPQGANPARRVAARRERSTSVGRPHTHAGDPRRRAFPRAARLPQPRLDGARLRPRPGARRDSATRQQFESVSKRLLLIVESVIVGERDRAHPDRPQRISCGREPAEEERLAGNSARALPALEMEHSRLQSLDRESAERALARSTAPPPVLLAAGPGRRGRASRHPTGRSLAYVDCARAGWSPALVGVTGPLPPLYTR